MLRAVLCAAVLLFFSCSKKEVEKTPESVKEMLEQALDLDNAIVQKPGEIVSVAAPVTLVFRSPVILPHLSGKVLDAGPFEFTPEVKGTSQWESTSQIKFTPEKHLLPGTQYKARFLGKVAFGKQKNVNDFEFQFKTAEQEIIEFAADFVPVPEGKNMVKMMGHLEFAQPVKPGILAGDLKVKLDSRKWKLELTADKSDERKLDFVSEPVMRGKTGQRIELSLPGRYTADSGPWRREVMLPPAGVFQVLGHMDMSDPKSGQSIYGFRFSDPVKAGADLSGYVSLSPQREYTISIDGKYLKIQGNFLPGSSYRIKLAEGFPSALGTKMPVEYTAEFSFSNLKPELEWLSKGLFMPSVNKQIVQFRSVNVAKVDVTVTEIYENNLGFFLQQNVLSEDNAQRKYHSGYSDLHRVGKQIYQKKLEISSETNRWVNTEIDLAKVMGDRKNSGFIVSLSFGEGDMSGRCKSDRNTLEDGDLFYEDDSYYGNPCQYGYYYEHGKLSKVLITSDVGLTLKRAEDGLHVYAVNVITAEPVSYFRLTLHSYLNQALETHSTDRNGHALFTEKEGYYIKGVHESGLALMRLNDNPWALSNFDVSGVNSGQGGFNTFMYADRGVHRPGDTVHLSLIVRQNRMPPPQDQPVVLKVRNPKNQVVFEEKKKCGAQGHVYFAIPTGLDDPTGTWSADAEIAGKHFSKPLKIETVKPDRLKNSIEVPDTVVLGEHSFSGAISSKYLFGTPAADLKARLKADFEGRNFTTDHFSDFTFGYPLRTYAPRTVTLLEKNLDGNGRAVFSHDITDAQNAPGILTADMDLTVYEKGGGFTRSQKRSVVVPFSAFVGIKNNLKWNSAQIGESCNFEIVVTDAKGNPVEGHRLKLRHYINRHYWWWDYDRRNQRDFRSNTSTYKISETVYISEKKPLKHRVKIEDEGMHMIEVIDEKSGHAAGQFFYGSRWGGTTENAEQAEKNFLQISADKNVYYTGDKARVSFESPARGMALMSLEQGGRIIKQEIRPLEGPSTVYEFEVTEEMVPNCYAVISLIQPHSETGNDLPLRIYGIKPLFVENPESRLPLAVKVPEEIRPNQEFTVSVTSGSKKEASYTIAVVDEGLLSLTGFDTPDPWKFYFQKLRLSVETGDNLDQIIGMLLPDMDKYLSIGGGLEAKRKERAGAVKVKRFKPVVLFQAPAAIRPGETQNVKLTMMNYVGAVRVMVVGTAEHSYSTYEKTVPVKQPLMLLTTVPRVARPGDVFSLPVSVFSMNPSIRDVKVTLEVSDALSIEGESEKTILFEKEGEKDVAFKVQVGGQIGQGKITVNASTGGRKAFDKVDLPIISHNPFITIVTDTALTAKGTVTLVPERFGLKGTNSASLAFSKVPDIQLKKRLNYLIQYPYGCIEQTTSGAFPQLFLGGLLDLAPHQKQAVTDHINAAIERLQRFVISGGFSYWPESHYHRSDFSDWGTNYAGHFLLEAKAAGYHIPGGLYDHWLSNSKRRAKTVNKDNHRYQAYRLFLLALAGEADQGAMNLVRENYLRDLDPLSKKFLAAAYHLAGQPAVAKEINSHSVTEITSYREMSGTYGSSMRDRALLAYLSIIMNDTQGAARLMRAISKEMQPGEWYSTQETAMVLMALCKMYVDQPITGSAVEFSVSMAGGKKEEYLLKNYQMVVSLKDMWGKEITIQTKHDNPLFISLVREGVPKDDIIKSESQDMELTRNFYDDDGRPMTMEDIRQGNPFWIRYRVRSLVSANLQELALSSLFPSGWEIINERMQGGELPAWVQKISSSSGKYMDIRDDRVNWFFDLGYRGESNFWVKVNPTFKGDYRLPPVAVEAMYSPDYFARIGGGMSSVR